MSNLRDKLKTKYKKAKKINTAMSDDDFAVFYKVLLTRGEEDYELDISDTIKANLAAFDEDEMTEIQIQMEKISAVRISIIQSIKTLRSRLTSKKVEHRIWLGEANQLGTRKYYDWIAVQRDDGTIKTLLRPPTKEDIIDYFLNDPTYKAKYQRHEKEIGHLNERIEFLKSVDDILEARAMALQSVLKQHPPVRYDSSLS